MPTSPKETKRLLELLIARKTLPFQEALDILANKNGKLNLPAVMERINWLWVEDCFTLVNKQGEEVSWNEDAPYQSPADYTLHFKSIAGKDHMNARMFCGHPDKNDVSEVSPGYVWATVQYRDQLRIMGEQEGAVELAERIRAFTHQFAFLLVTGQHEKLAGLFSSRAEKGLDALLTRIANIEKEYGAFDYFDHVEVFQVFNGDFAKAKSISHMELPKTIKRNEQRGQATFQIISARTPNGMYVHDYTVRLDVIEEEYGFLKVAVAEVYSGY